jgi:hypothetical protein
MTDFSCNALPVSVWLLKPNSNLLLSEIDNKSFVSDEIDKLLMKGCISRVELKPHVVNPLTVVGNKAKLRLILVVMHYPFDY